MSHRAKKTEKNTDEKFLNTLCVFRSFRPRRSSKKNSLMFWTSCCGASLRNRNAPQKFSRRWLISDRSRLIFKPGARLKTDRQTDRQPSVKTMCKLGRPATLAGSPVNATRRARLGDGRRWPALMTYAHLLLFGCIGLTGTFMGVA